MKKFLLLAALALPSLLFSQVDIPSSVIAGFSKYVQFSQVSAQPGIKVKVMSSVGSDPKHLYQVVGMDGKDFVFQLDAEVINWMDRQGFDFVDFIPVWPVETSLPGVGYYRKMLFKKRV